MDRLYLPDHAWFCFFDKVAAFIDLRNDEYIVIEERECAALRELAENGGQTNERTRSALKELIDYGLLTPDERGARPFSPTTCAASTTPLLADDEVAPGRIGVREFCNFWYACISVDSRLRWGQAYYTVMRMRQLKLGARKQESDVDRLRELIGVFRQLRPQYLRPYTCLFDTLALLEFLACYQFFPTYAVGYNIATGDGHLWAQLGDWLLLDDPEIVARYTPVMAL